MIFMVWRCSRIEKEFKMYQKEAKTQEEKVKKMESDGKDEYDIRKQVKWLHFAPRMENI